MSKSHPLPRVAGPPPGTVPISHFERGSDRGSTCKDCRFWERLVPVGKIAPPVDPQFATRCREAGLDPQKNAHLASYGRCRGAAPTASGPVQWPLTPALEPLCVAFRPRNKP